MLIAALEPLLSRTTLRLDLRSASNGTVHLTIVPQKLEGQTSSQAVLQPISLTATAAELDSELAKGESGALGRLVSSRKTLADQVEEQTKADAEAAKQAREAAQKKSAEKTKQPVLRTAHTTSPAVSKPVAPATPEEPDSETPAEPVSLWD